jgi:membrane-associated phospholipid phosphatase
MEKITLKNYISHRNKSLFFPILAGIFMAFYTVSGAISYQSGGFLPMSQFEQDIPFLPWTIWIYIVLYPIYLIWCLYGYKDISGINKTAYSFLVLTLISCGCFILFPVVYPRNMYPLGFHNDLTTIIFKAMRAADKPSNCLPSLHVGLCFLFAYGFYHENKVKFGVAFFISIVVAISTLTTKQHYIYDIVLGFIFSTGIYLLFNRLTSVSTKND